MPIPLSTLPFYLYLYIHTANQTPQPTDVIIGILFTLLIATAVAYLPNHIAVISNRLWYYVHGEFLFASASAASSSTTGVDGGALQQDGMAAAAIATKGAAAAVGGVLKNVVKSEL